MNTFKEGEKVVCVDTTDILNDKLVLGEVYTVSHVLDWGNIDVQNNHGETLHNFKPWRFKLIEDPKQKLLEALSGKIIGTDKTFQKFAIVERKHYTKLVEENEELKSSVKILREDLVFQEQMIRKLIDAGQIFQVDGKYHKEANLPIGSSCVVEGIKWMDKEIEKLKKELKWQEDERLRIQSKLYSAELRLATAQNRLDQIRKLA